MDYEFKLKIAEISKDITKELVKDTNVNEKTYKDYTKFVNETFNIIYKNVKETIENS